MRLSGELPIPPHYDPTKVGLVWRVPYGQRAAEAREWARIHNIKPATTDDFRVLLLLVDCQNTFCIPDFELFVAGRSGMAAVEDNERLCRFIYRNLGSVTEIHATVDTHQAVQIFHPLFWVDLEGRHPEPMTMISASDVEKGLWTVNPAIGMGTDEMEAEQRQRYALHYTRELEARGKYQLTIWPYHAMLGGIGHALVSAVEEAVFFHQTARHGNNTIDIKGRHVLTEHYSVLRPEVMQDQGGNPLGEMNTGLIERLIGFDMVLIAGQAKSHCVAWTVADLVEEMGKHGTEQVQKLYLLEDCTSPVVVAGVVDFTEQAEEAFRRFADAGMQVMRSE
ncbi:MAG: isochorismatase [Pseudomonadota bacterium]